MRPRPKVVPFRSGEPVTTPDGWGYIGNPKGSVDHVIVQLIREDGFSIKGFDLDDVKSVPDRLRDIGNMGVADGIREKLYDLANTLDGICWGCEGSGYERTLGRDNDEIVTDCSVCGGAA